VIGNRLNTIIKESGHTQETAGNLIGVGKSTINTWIKKENVQNSSKFYQLCRTAGWNSDWILTGRGEKYVGSFYLALS
jgi:DNA-binding XRE family transcriptional regulator